MKHQIATLLFTSVTSRKIKIAYVCSIINFDNLLNTPFSQSSIQLEFSKCKNCLLSKTHFRAPYKNENLWFTFFFVTQSLYHLFAAHTLLTIYVLVLCWWTQSVSHRKRMCVLERGTEEEQQRLPFPPPHHTHTHTHAATLITNNIKITSDSMMWNNLSHMNLSWTGSILIYKLIKWFFSTSLII